LTQATNNLTKQVDQLSEKVDRSSKDIYAAKVVFSVLGALVTIVVAVLGIVAKR
jgi:DNA-binding protein YbaB